MNLLWSPGMKMDEVERNVIVAALKYYRGNRTQAANSLGLSLRTIVTKIKLYREAGITVPEFLLTKENEN